MLYNTYLEGDESLALNIKTEARTNFPEGTFADSAVQLKVEEIDVGIKVDWVGKATENAAAHGGKRNKESKEKKKRLKTAGEHERVGCWNEKY